jgi:nucleoid-associated protein YgaU
MRRLFRATSLLTLLSFEIAAIATLHRLGAEPWLQIGWSDLDGWLRGTAPEDALGAAIRTITLVLAYWMLTTTALYATARLLRLRTAWRAVEWATIPAVRRIVDGAVAVSIATASLAAPVSPALAQVPTPVVIEIDDEGRPLPPGTSDVVEPEAGNTSTTPIPPGLDRIGWTPTPAGVLPMGTSPTIDPAETPSRPSTASIAVEPGDNLWVISARHLETTTGADADNATIARYWRRVVDANRAHLRSGDPDLIYAGEAVRLPPIDPEAP